MPKSRDGIEGEVENIEDDFEQKKEKDVQYETETTSLQKGRFTVETSISESIKEEHNGNLKKGRFLIEKAHEDIKDQNGEFFEILDLNHQQMEILFDMIKNIAGEDKLFQKEFMDLSNKVYEKLEFIRRKLNK
jgi:hypothetical protein